MQAIGSEFLHKRLETIAPASRCNYLVIAGSEAFDDRGAKAGSCSCDEQLHLQSPDGTFRSGGSSCLLCIA